MEPRSRTETARCRSANREHEVGGREMKRCLKLPEPISFSAYRHAQPAGTWDDIRNDPFHGGMQAYRDAKNALVKGQRCFARTANQELPMERAAWKSRLAGTYNGSSISM